MENICQICYETSYSKCPDNLCTSALCKTCLDTYLNVCLQENRLPTCINENCKSYYLKEKMVKKKKKTTLLEQVIDKSFEEIEIEIRNKKEILYDKCIFNYFLKNHGKAYENKLLEHNYLKEQCLKKKQIIESEFPKGIAFTIDLLFKSRLNKISKDNKKVIQEMLDSTNKLCMNNFCKGKLDKNFQCIACNTKFCKKCELVLQDNHVCDKNLVESIELINKFVPCPNCGIHIERSDGCPSMKCSVCKTKFDYITGEKGGHGNNHNVEIKVKDNYKLSTTYQISDKKIQRHINNIEIDIPKIITFEEISKLLFNYLTDIASSSSTDLEKIEEIYRSKISRKFEQHVKSKILYKKYICILGEYEKLIKDNSLTFEESHKLYKKIQNDHVQYS